MAKRKATPVLAEAGALAQSPRRSTRVRTGPYPGVVRHQSKVDVSDVAAVGDGVATPLQPGCAKVSFNIVAFDNIQKRKTAPVTSSSPSPKSNRNASSSHDDPSRAADSVRSLTKKTKDGNGSGTLLASSASDGESQLKAATDKAKSAEKTVLQVKKDTAKLKAAPENLAT